MASDDVPFPPPPCEELAQTGTPLFCMLAPHDGPWHYDAVDDITWAKGRHLPGEAVSGG